MKLPGFLKQWKTTTEMVIQDARLGILSIALQLCVLLYAILLIARGGWKYVETPTGVPNVWFESGNLTRAHITGKSSKCMAQGEASDACFCEHLDRYDFNYKTSASYWNELDIKCLSMGYGEIVRINAQDGFATTYVKQEHRLMKPCNGVSMDACSQLPELTGLRQSANEHTISRPSGEHTCTCSYQQDYFVLGVDDMELAVEHQFSTSASMGSISGSSVNTGNGDMEKKIKTCLKKKPLAEKCKSKSGVPISEDLWGECCLEEAEPGATLKHPIGRWIEASGVSLDQRLTTNVVAPDATSGMYPYRRITGVKLHFHMKYYGYDRSDTFVCEIEVQAEDGWTSIGSAITYTRFNSFGDTEYYESYKRGIRFEFFSSGQVYKFDPMMIVATVTSSLVFLGLCQTIVGFVAFNVLPEKTVYKKGKTEELNYGKALAQFGISTALACTAFKLWNKDASVKEGEEQCVSLDELALVFEGGNLGSETSKQFAEVVIEQAAREGTGKELRFRNIVELMASPLVSLAHMKDYAKKNADGMVGNVKVVPG